MKPQRVRSFRASTSSSSEASVRPNATVSAPRSIIHGLLVVLAFVTSLAPGRPAHAVERLAGPVEAEVIRVVDGDTLVARARIWLGQTVETHVRLAGVDAPELRGKCAEEKARALAAREALARLVGEGPVMLADIESDKYGGRVLARVATGAHDDVAAALVEGGFVRAYAGGARSGWCGAEG